MALQLNLPEDKTSVGVSAPAAYAHIVHLGYQLKTGKVVVDLDVHFNQAARASNKNPIHNMTFNFRVAIDGPNLDAALPEGLRAAIYAWLKAQPDFAGATDV